MLLQQRQWLRTQDENIDKVMMFFLFFIPSMFVRSLVIVYTFASVIAHDGKRADDDTFSFNLTDSICKHLPDIINTDTSYLAIQKNSDTKLK